MATLSRRSWKLQDFMAHNANVNCLSLGHKSGRVMVTGGDDKKVNLWAIGKHSCFMSLSGHQTPIECVQFNQLEELVCAGSRAGSLKVWDLEAAKLVRTLNGHKYTIKCIDFHPFGELLGSGSADSSIKLWDTRKKGVLLNYNGHKGTVNSIKFSPDGQWIASGGEDGTVKIWDMRTNRVLREFADHTNAVNCVEFHPHEFLLVTGGADRSVRFFDLETFGLVSSEGELGAVRCVCFNPDGECLFVGARDCLKIVGWEPSRLYDGVPVSWGRVCDISTAQCQLVGASFHLTNVQVFVVDLKRCRPLGAGDDGLGEDVGGDADAHRPALGPFAHNQNARKSFSRAERPAGLLRRTLDVRPTIEESTSGTDPEEDSAADITNIKDYNEIFRGRGLTRTPPLEPEPFQEPERDISDPSEPQVLGGHPVHDSFEALSLDNNLNNYSSPPPALTATQYSRSKSNLDQVYISRLTKQQDNRENLVPTKPVRNNQKYNLQRQSSVKDVPEKLPKPNNIKHSVSEANINKGYVSSRNSSRKNSFSKPSRNSSVPNITKQQTFTKPEKPHLKSLNIINPPVDIYVSSKLSPEDRPIEEDEYIPSTIDRPVGLNLDDFLPKSHGVPGFEQQLPDMSEAEVMGVLIRGFDPMMGIIRTRQKGLKIVLNQCRSKDIKAAVESAVAMDDITLLVDVLGVINNKYSAWSLDLCVVVLPKIFELLQSKYEQYMTVGCNTLRLILRHFGPVIRTNVQSPAGSFGVDISREERYRKSVKCHELLSQLRPSVAKKVGLPGAVGAAFREVNALLASHLD